MKNYLVPSINSTLEKKYHFDSDDLIKYFKLHEKKESYYCLYNLEPRDSFKEYSGEQSCSLGSVVFDLDSDSLENAQVDSIKLYEHLKLSEKTARIFFSGSKGFHIYVSAEYLGLDKTSKTLAKECGKLAEKLKVVAKTLDLSVYKPAQKFRSPNSRHPKTGLYKVCISYEQLSGLSIKAIKELAENPKEYDFNYSSGLRFGGSVVDSIGNSADAYVTQVSTNYGLPDQIDNPFLTYAHKKCIKSFETTRLDTGNRHTAALTLISEYKARGLTQDECTEKMRTFASLQGTLERWETDTLRMIDDAYLNDKTYGSGCYHFLKKEYCAKDCGLYNKLDKNKRKQFDNDLNSIVSVDNNDTKSMQVVTNYRSVDELTPLAEFPFPGQKTPKQNQQNVEFLLETYGISARYNIIKKDILIHIPGKKYLIDGEKNDKLTTIVSLAIQNNMKAQMIPEYIANLAGQNVLNPVKDWVYSKAWDGVDRLTSFFSTVTAEGEQDPKVRGFKETLILKWMCSALKAALDPHGVSAHGVLVFSGSQGIGKTAWFKSLVPSNLEITRDGMMLNPQDKDSVYQCVSNWLVELGEVDSTFRKADLAQLKAFLTKDRDILRLPYRREASEFIRRTVFFASVNDMNYLSDDTGNRRFWSINTISINYNHGLDMQQIWAQVESLRLGGLKWFLTDDELKQLNEHNKDFEAIDPIDVNVRSKISVSQTEVEGSIAMDAIAVANALGIDKPTRRDLNLLGVAIFKIFGVKSSVKKVGSVARRVYFVKLLEKEIC